MTTYDIEYKQGDVDSVGAVLSQYDPLVQSNVVRDLTGCTVTLVMKDIETETHRFVINCTLGGTYQGVYYSAARGGITIPFADTNTAVAGLFYGEFIVVGNGSTAHIPSGNKYLQIMIWDAI